MGNGAVGSSWQDARKEIFTPEENAASDLRVSIILELIKARREKGYSQSELSELSGIKQSTIDDVESGRKIPNLLTLQKLLTPLGRKMAVVQK